MNRADRARIHRCSRAREAKRKRKSLTHPNDPALRSFLPIDAESDFPIQNLPYGVFSTSGSPKPRVGVAIGESILDLAVLESEGLIDLAPAGVFAQPSINAFMAAGAEFWSGVPARSASCCGMTFLTCAT